MRSIRNASSQRNFTIFFINIQWISILISFNLYSSKKDLESKEQAKFNHLRSQTNKRNEERLNTLQDAAQKEASKIVIFWSDFFLKKHLFMILFWKLKKGL